MAFTGAEYYDKAKQQYATKAAADLKQQQNQINQASDSQLQQAYIQRMQGQTAMQNNLAMQGIRGGASETAQMNLMNTYQGTRNTINSDRATALTQAQTSYNDNIFNYNQQMDTAKAEYQQQMLPQYYDSLYGKSYSIKDLKKSLKKASSAEQKMAINKRIAYLREHKKGY